MPKSLFQLAALAAPAAVAITPAAIHCNQSLIDGDTSLKQTDDDDDDDDKSL